MNTLLIIIVLLLLLGAFPAWSFRSDWGNGPVGILGVVLVVVVLLMLFGGIR